MREKAEHEANQKRNLISEFPDTRQFMFKNLCSVNNLLHCNVLFCFMLVKKREISDRMSTAKFVLYGPISSLTALIFSINSRNLNCI